MRRDWPPFEVVIFDCDSTLTTIEGIDELTGLNGRKADISALTEQAMNGTVPLETVYRHRLELLRVTRAQVRQLRSLYRKNTVRGVEVELKGKGMTELVKPVTVALLKGLLDFTLSEPVNFVNSPALAAERGIAVSQTRGMNLAEWRLGRDRPGGAALSFVNLDQPITNTQLEELKHLPQVTEAKLVQL